MPPSFPLRNQHPPGRRLPLRRLRLPVARPPFACHVTRAPAVEPQHVLSTAVRAKSHASSVSKPSGKKPRDLLDQTFGVVRRLSRHNLRRVRLGETSGMQRILRILSCPPSAPTSCPPCRVDCPCGVFGFWHRLII